MTDLQALIQIIESGELSERIELIKAMDFIICSLNNTEAMDLWLIEGPGDEAGIEEYAYCALNEGLFKNIQKAFLETIIKYGEDGWFRWNWAMSKDLPAFMTKD